jgi:serine/threonine-protein kinase
MMPWIALFALAGGVMLAFNFWRSTLPHDVKIPAVEGVNVTQAQRDLRSAGLHVEVLPRRQFSETVPEDHVVTLDPPVGRLVKEGRTVKVVVSAGSAFTKVPEVRELPEGMARERIREAELRIATEEYVVHKTIPLNRVIAVTPAPGAKVKRGSAVHLKISQGAEVQEDLSISELRSSVLTVELPDDADIESAEVRIDVTDDEGMRTIMQEQRHPGETVIETVQGVGAMTVEVFFADRLILTRKL